MLSKADLENPEYEKSSFGMITYGACSLIRRTHKVWNRLLNAEMRQFGYDRFYCFHVFLLLAYRLCLCFSLTSSFEEFVSEDERVAWDKFDAFWGILEATQQQGMSLLFMFHHCDLSLMLSSFMADGS